MPTASQSTIDDVAERVRKLIAEARAALPDVARGSDESDPADALSASGRTTLRALGSDAAALLEGTEPAALLAALDIDRPDVADSVPAAILAGDPDDVASLRAILTLSRLAGDEDAEPSFDEGERDAMATLAPLLLDESASETTTDETATAADRTDAETPSDPAESPTKPDAGDDADGDEISAVLREALDDVRTDLDDVLGIGDGGEPSAEGSDTEESDDETDDAGESGDEASDVDESGGEGGLADTAASLVDEAGSRLSDVSMGAGDENGVDHDGEGDEAGTTADDTDEAEGLLGMGDDGLSLDDRSISGGASGRTRQSVSGLGRATYSTMPARDRPDMSGVPRYRTLADR